MKKLCIVIPFRNREMHLKQLVPVLKKMLDEQKLEYKICVVEQDNEETFNRARLLNIGFDLNRECDYFCFHDVDLLPLESDYTYTEHPTHLSAHCSQFNFELPYPTLLGGVMVINKEDFLKVNGYSNMYAGWGCEDDDLYYRCIISGLKVMRKPGRYTSLYHERNIDSKKHKVNIDRYVKVQKEKLDIHAEGLNTLSYVVTLNFENRDYTHYKVS